jgi:4-amino-4-deoxy-L-arabinose transferase-like glycosyltransferase
MKKKSIFLFLILILAAFLRLWRLNQVPPSPSLDEVSLGWNAYSILKTGRDEYGYRWPILLRAYDDWRPASYVYLVIPWVQLLGLSVAAVRLPAVILTLISIIITYLLVKELFKDWTKAEWLALLSSFLLAISPWSIYLSRLGHEVNLGLTVLLLAILFFLKFVNQQKNIFLFWSAIFFAFSLCTYQSLKVVSPLLLLCLLIIYRTCLIKKRKTLFLAGVLGLALVIPVILLSFSGDRLIRFRGSSLLSSEPEIFVQSAQRVKRDWEQHYWWGLLFDNRRLAGASTIFQAYFSHFNPRWLFFNQGADKHKIPGLGLFFLWEMPFMAWGLHYLWTDKFNKKTKFLLLSWCLLAPIPAALTTQAPHAMRSYNLLPIPPVLTALGVIYLFSKIEKGKKLMAAGIVGLIFISLVYLAHNYFINFPFEQSDSFQYPLAQGIKYVIGKENQYDQIVMTNQKQGYLSFLLCL